MVQCFYGSLCSERPFLGVGFAGSSSQRIISGWVCKFFPSPLLFVPFLEAVNGLAFTPSWLLRRSGGISSSTSMGAPAVLLMAHCFELQVIEGAGCAVGAETYTCNSLMRSGIKG